MVRDIFTQGYEGTGFRKGGLKRGGDEETCFRKSCLKRVGPGGYIYIGIYLHRDMKRNITEKVV